MKTADKLKEMGAGVQVIALSVADSYTTVQHARQAHLPFAAVPFPSAELQQQYGAGRVPLTVAIDSQGVVQAVWDGPLDAGAIGDVVGTLHPEFLGNLLSARTSQSKEGRRK